MKLGSYSKMSKIIRQSLADGHITHNEAGEMFNHILLPGRLNEELFRTKLACAVLALATVILLSYIFVSSY